MFGRCTMCTLRVWGYRTGWLPLCQWCEHTVPPPAAVTLSVTMSLLPATIELRPHVPAFVLECLAGGAHILYNRRLRPPFDTPDQRLVYGTLTTIVSDVL
jgi:hypothetical protein